MKKLELKQMENLEGGVDQRNCAMLGVTIIGGAVGGFASFGGGWIFAGGAFLTAMGAGCF